MKTRGERYVDERLKRPGAGRVFREGWNELQLAARIAYLRRRKHLTQTQIAAKMRTSPAVISRIESGKLGSVRTLQRYAHALGLTLYIDFLSPAHGPKDQATAA